MVVCLKKYIKIFLCFCFLAILIYAALKFFAYKPKTIEEAKNWTETYYDIKSEKLSEEAGSLKIVHLSDFHQGAYELPTAVVYTIVKEQDPDIVVLTGDMVEGDYLETHIQSFLDVEAIQLMSALAQVAETYYVMGNNDYFENKYAQRSYEDILEESGVHILRDESDEIVIKGQKIVLSGINDPIYNKSSKSSAFNTTSNSVKEVSSALQEDALNILLVHRPEFFSLYQYYDYDLVLAGHTHGGQFRLFNKPVIKIPGQKYPAKYVNGLYEENGQYMIINRGLGTSSVPLRINCPPEIGVITITKKATD